MAGVSPGRRYQRPTCRLSIDWIDGRRHIVLHKCGPGGWAITSYGLALCNATPLAAGPCGRKYGVGPLSYPHWAGQDSMVRLCLCEGVWEGEERRRGRRKRKLGVGVALYLCILWGWQMGSPGPARPGTYKRRLTCSQLIHFGYVRSSLGFNYQLPPSRHSHPHKVLIFFLSNFFCFFLFHYLT